VGEIPHWVTVLLVCLATHRLTRLVTRDALPIVAIPREWIDRHWGMEESDVQSLKAALAADPSLRDRLWWPNVLKRSVAYLITCDWCTSVWVAGGVTVFTKIYIGGFGWMWAPLMWLTASSVTGLIAQREPD
jgi:hypothetical protein